MIYLDNAATTSPKPAIVIKTACEAISLHTANPGRSGHEMSRLASEAIYNARKTIANFFGIKNCEHVIFTPGCTYSINMALKGLLSPGSHVIISDLEHNAVVRPLYALSKTGVTFSRAHIVENYPDETVKNFERLINPHTKMIFCTHASNVFGIKLPVKEIGLLCKEHGILFGIDAAQTAGVTEILLGDINADIVCAPSHKGLYGIMGSGLMLLGDNIVPNTIIEGGTGSYSSRRTMPDELPDRLESGTANVCGILSMKAGVKFIGLTGIGGISEHEFSLMRKAYEGLFGIRGVNLHTSIPHSDTHVPLLSFTVKNMPSETLGAKLSDMGIAVRAGLHCAYDAHRALGTEYEGTVRICPSYFTTEREIDEFLPAVECLSHCAGSH